MGPAGPLFGVLFYLLVTLAAVTSAIALIEVLVTFFMDHAALKNGKTANRGKVVALVCLAILAEAVLVAMDGLGANGLWIPFQKTGLTFTGSWLDFMDFISEGVAMPLGALLMSLLVGWIVGPKLVRSEVCREGSKFGPGLYRFFTFCIRIVAPLGMLMILLGQVSSFLKPL